MDRKSFIERTLGLMLIALPTYSLVSCSSSDDGSGDPDPNPNPNPNGQGGCVANGTNSSIGANHGHSLTVSSSDVQSGTERTYSIQGSSGHDHMVTLTAANFADLQNDMSINVVSTNDAGHTHPVTVSCA